MHCRYTHHTRYDFDRPVFLEPHLIRLVPRGDAGQRLGALRIDVDPVPAPPRPSPWRCLGR
ncbi:transglutaminase N-terminal domain-containing protein [Solidesulfovibrio sp. C21]|uniref:transglutaminase N-terminal domain-containing protein n=1 Tax=Solidesulfovibrio sp. C21 TaxID=3398613 RepID=UPI0039FC3F05